MLIAVYTRNVCACFQFSCSTQDTGDGLVSIIHLITIKCLLTNSLKIKLCRWWLGALSTNYQAISAFFWCEMAKYQFYFCFNNKFPFLNGQLQLTQLQATQ